MKKYRYRLFYMEPPILKSKKPAIYEFEEETFDAAYRHSKALLKKNHPEGTVPLMLAQLDR